MHEIKNRLIRKIIIIKIIIKIHGKNCILIPMEIAMGTPPPPQQGNRQLQPTPQGERKGRI